MFLSLVFSLYLSVAPLIPWPLSLGFVSARELAVTLLLNAFSPSAAPSILQAIIHFSEVHFPLNVLLNLVYSPSAMGESFEAN
jgi:hypothetical protein